MARVSLDLDRPTTQRDAERAAAFIERATGATPRIYRTASGGYHVETDHIDSLSVQNSLALRFILGDDPQRLRMDIQRIREGKAFDFLFSVRRGIERVQIA